MLFGKISIVGLENVEYFEKFGKLFECDWDYMDSALIAVGNYIQCEHNNWRYQIGTGNRTVLSACQDLFHKSSNNGYANTKKYYVNYCRN